MAILYIVVAVVVVVQLNFGRQTGLPDITFVRLVYDL